jgi:hypothetical protein
MADETTGRGNARTTDETDRFATDSANAPQTPLAAPPKQFSSAGTSQVFADIAANEEKIEREDALKRRIHGVFTQLDNFGKIAEDPNFDERAYESLRALSADTLEPLNQLLGQRASLRTQLLAFQAEQTAAARAQTEMQQQLREMTAARDTLQQAA